MKKYCRADYTDFNKALKHIWEQVKIDNIWDLIDCQIEKEGGCNYANCRILDDDEFEHCPKVYQYLKDYYDIKLSDVDLIEIENVSYCDKTIINFYKKTDNVYVKKVDYLEND